MKRENVLFFVGGLLFGLLLGYGLFHVLENRPSAQMAAAGSMGGRPTGPMGPSAMTGVPPSAPAPPAGAAMGGAPMLEEVTGLKRTVQANPRDVAAWTRLANLYHDAGMWDEAIVSYEKAIGLSPGNPDLLTDLGICFQQKRDFAKALDLFRQAQEADPSHWQSLYNTAVVNGLDLGRMEEAEVAVTKLERLGAPPQALQQIRQALDAARSGRAGRS